MKTTKEVLKGEIEEAKAGCRRMMQRGKEQWDRDDGSDFSYELLWAITECAWLQEED